MRIGTGLKLLSIASAFLGSSITAQAADIVVGFATASSGFMQAYDKPAQDAAMMRIDEITTTPITAPDRLFMPPTTSIESATNVRPR